MNTKARGAYHSPVQLSELIVDPTNFSFKEYSSIFGEDIAKHIYNSLYKSTTSKRAFRQIYPTKIMADPVTRKYVFTLADGFQIETVVIKRRTGNTLCMSTQAGCPVQCRFCKSGENGLIRNLTTSEIVQQYLFVNEIINRIVFMGIGEPLYNYDDVLNAIHILRDRNGIDFPTDGISISTVGPVDKLQLLREEHLKIQLVLSLHATDQETRDYLIPGMASHKINEVIALTMEYGRRHNRKVSIAYLLLPGINNRKVDIDRLSKWFGNKNIVLNLLKYNGKSKNEFRTISSHELMSFKEQLEKRNVSVTLRRSMGDSIEAACGQLVTNNSNKP